MSAFIRNCFWMAQDVKNLLWPSQLTRVVRGRDFSQALVKVEEARDSWGPGELPGLFEPADETDGADYLSWPEPPTHTFCQKCGGGYIGDHTCLRDLPPVPPGGNPEGSSPPNSPSGTDLNLPWTTADLTDDWWLKGAFPGGVLDRWGVVIGRFDSLEQAEAVVAAISLGRRLCAHCSDAAAPGEHVCWTCLEEHGPSRFEM